eukprot:scaffold2653_cov84-Cylindrotheca_fusiformis.AAC.1
MRSLRMPCGKTKEHIPIGPLWRRHRHRLNDVEMLSLNVSPPHKGDQAYSGFRYFLETPEESSTATQLQAVFNTC